MKITGHCYCGAVRYESEGEPVFRGQCHCRECQYVSGGHPNLVMAMPEPGFRYVQGAPKAFRRADLDPARAVTREFCAECGTHVVSRAPALAGTVMLKVGTFDDPSLFGGPQMIIFTIDKQAFHHVPPGVPAFERFPG
jgi:hypothetical protein